MTVLLKNLINIGTNTYLLEFQCDKIEILKIDKIFNETIIGHIIIKQRKYNKLIEFIIYPHKNLLIGSYFYKYMDILMNKSFVEPYHNKKAYKLTSKALVSLL